MRRFLRWYLPAGVATAVAALLAAGFAAGISGRLGVPVSDTVLPSPTPAPPVPAGTYLIAALGDSMTRGAGDASGGYPERVARALRRAGRNAVVENLAVDGSETRDILRRMSDPGLERSVDGANLILLSAAGNDLTHSLRRASPGDGEPAAAMDDARKAASANLRSLLAAIRAANVSAPIRIIGLYDPSGDTGAVRRIEREGLLAWNVALEEACFSVSGCLVVPIADLFEGRPDRLAADRFHPGPAGYDEIAARVLSTLVTSRAAGRTARESER